jgi:hypothetical protein
VRKDIEIDAEHIAAMIDDPDVELLGAIWTDFRELGGVAMAALKGGRRYGGVSCDRAQTRAVGNRILGAE